MAQNNQINVPIPFAINKGGTGVTSVTTTPTASAWSGWDANKNHSAVGYIPGYTTTVTSASPVVLTVGSNQQQFFTGSTAQTLTMPVANTCVVGQYWSIINNSSAVVTIQSSGSNTILALPASSETVVTCITASGTSAASWVTSPAVSGSGTVNSGLINQLAWYSASGTAVSGLATANSSGLLTNGSGVPAWVTVTGTGAPVLGTGPTITAPLINAISDQTFNLPVMAFSGVTSAVNVIQAVNSSTGNALGLQFSGTDSNVKVDYTTKGTGTHSFFNGLQVSTQPLFVISGAATNTVNYITATGVVTGSSPTLSVTGTDSNIILTLQGKGTGGVTLLGTSTNDSAAAGYVGELLTASNDTGSPITFTTAAKTLQTVTLTPGDWDVWGNIFISATTVTTGQVGLSLVNNTQPNNSLTTFDTGASSVSRSSSPHENIYRIFKYTCLFSRHFYYYRNR